MTPAVPPADDLPDLPEPDEAAWMDALLLEALAAPEPGSKTLPAPEATPGDGQAELEALVQDGSPAALLGNAHLRALFSDLCGDVQQATQAAHAGSLPGHLRTAALRAMERAQHLQGAASGSGDPGLAGEGDDVVQVQGSRRLRTLTSSALYPMRRRRVWRAAAAVLVAGLGAVAVGLLALNDPESALAREGLSLAHLARLDVESGGWFSQVEPGRVAAAGEVFAPQGAELLALSPTPLSRVVVRAGDRMSVDRAARGTGYVLRLEHGEARLQAGQEALEIEIGQRGRLRLSSGFAHVVLQEGAAGEAWPALALLKDSAATFLPAQGATELALHGPTRVLLSERGVEAEGEPALSLFRELRLFGGELPEPTPVAAVGARRWEVLSGSARRFRRHLELRDAQAWRLGVALPESLAEARRLRVQLRAPAGTRVALEGGGETTCATEVAEDGRVSEPGLCSVALHLPEQWFDRLGPDGLVLSIQLPQAAGSPASVGAAARTVSFEGALVEFDAQFDAEFDADAGAAGSGSRAGAQPPDLAPGDER